MFFFKLSSQMFIELSGLKLLKILFRYQVFSYVKAKVTLRYIPFR